MAKVTKELRKKCFKMLKKECGSARSNPTCASKTLKDCFRGKKK